MPRVLFLLSICVAIVVSFSGCATGASSPEPEVSNVDEAFVAGITKMSFDDWAGPPIPVWMYVPHDTDPKTAPILIMMHGAKRGAKRYLGQWEQIADRDGFIVIAPEFNKEKFKSSRTYQQGNVYRSNRTLELNPEAKWTFSAIDPIFEHVKKKLGNTQEAYTFYGHSGGSQFVHRSLLFKDNPNVVRFLPANAGWYTYADMTIDYPYGLKGTDVTEDHLKAVLQKDVVILLGDQDIDVNHSSLRRTEEANAQGPHRYARGQAFYENAKANAQKYGVPFGWSIRVVPGVAHSNGGIAKASGDLVE